MGGSVLGNSGSSLLSQEKKKSMWVRMKGWWKFDSGQMT